MHHPTFDSHYWENRYQNGETRWDMKEPAPWLLPVLAAFPDKSSAVLVPGCGNGHEVISLLEKGYKHVTALDFSESACRQLSDHIPQGYTCNIVCEDFFAHKGTYDLILEQTFFCSFDPSRRKEYVSHMHSLLAPKGTLTGVLFASEFSVEGPPFGGSKEEYLQLFRTHFTSVQVDTCMHSHAARAGNELLFRCEK